MDCCKKAAELNDGKTNNKAAAAAISNGVEVFLMVQESQKQGFPDDHKLLLQPNIWIGNTTATMDMTLHAKSMVGMKKSEQTVSIVMGNKQVETSVAIGDIPGVVCDNQGYHVLSVKMTDVALVPDCTFNLFSISKRLKQGLSLAGDVNAMELISPDNTHQIKFDLKISMTYGTLIAMYVKCTQEQIANTASTNDKGTKQVKMSVQRAHEKLGHINERATKALAKNLGWLFTDNQPLNCATCMAGKA